MGWANYRHSKNQYRTSFLIICLDSDQKPLPALATGLETSDGSEKRNIHDYIVIAFLEILDFGTAVHFSLEAAFFSSVSRKTISEIPS